jgi:site-specific recombinase XerD
MHAFVEAIDLRVIQAYLGHRSPQTTALYTSLNRPSNAIAVIVA